MELENCYALSSDLLYFSHSLDLIKNSKATQLGQKQQRNEHD